MRIVRYLLEHKLALLLVFAILCVQAFCDLSLPRYTSDIVDTGIQQKGIEDAATTVMSARTFDAICMMADESDEELLRSSYTEQADGTYELNSNGEAQREALDEIVAVPLIVVEYSSQIEGFDLDQTLVAYEAGMISKADISSAVEAAEEQMGSESIVEQQALAAAQAEYEALGVDTSSIQMSYLWRIGLEMLLLAALMMLCNIAVAFVAARTGTKIGRDLRKRLFAQVVNFSEREIDSFSSASLITRCTNDIQLIQMVSIALQRMVLYAPILAVGGIIMVTQTNASMGWIIAVAVVAVFAAVGVLMAIAMPKFKILQSLIDKVNLISREILTGLPVVRAFNREEHEQARFGQANTALMKTQLFTNRVMTFMMPAMMLIMNIVSVCIVWIGGHAIDSGSMQTGDLIAFITYSMIIISSFLIIGMIAILLPRASVAAGRVDEVLAATASIVDAPEVQDAQLASTPGAEIAFEDVCFAYAQDSANVVDHLSFTAQAGKTTAIIGSTGSGKSTIIKLIERFYDVTSGRITVDGIDVRNLSQNALRATFGYSPQQAFLFSGTIASNVGYSTGDEADERIPMALEVAQASEFVASKEEGVDAPVSQGGTNVSGGQRQRLSIARALAADARAYLFDDSFSALDYKTDAQLRAELSKRLGGKTVLIVAQRIATIMHADKIIVLEDGRSVGQGTHEQLLASCPQYRAIAESQLSQADLARGGAA